MRKTDVLDALNALGIEGNCPVCARNSWAGVGPPNADVQVALKLPGIDPDTDTEFDPASSPWDGLKCAVRVCTTCGWVSLHAVSVLQQLL